MKKNRYIIHHSKTLLLIFTGILLLINTFSWQTLSAQSQSPKDEKVYSTYKLKSLAPKIDGNPDEMVWNDSGWKTGFTQRTPIEGAKASQKTDFSILYDDNYLYIAFRLYDDEPDKIDARLSRRDSWGGDAAVVYIDSYLDKQTAFMFGVTAGGVKNDGIASGNSEHADMNPDPIWDVKTQLTDYGWSAEMRIPLNELRFPDKEKPVWGLQVARYIYRNDEYALWQHIAQDQAGWASNFGELRGVNKVSSKRQVRITPYLSTQFEMYEAAPDNPLSDGKEFSANAGVNGKIGITNNFILDFAINPDFGQVEADPSQVNLTAHESFFSEKRPFFIEGSSITDYRISSSGNSWTRDNLLYSRRIGRQTRFVPIVKEDEYYKVPNYIKIPFAAKLTGKTQNGWSVGIINAMTARTFAEIESQNNTRKESVEPFTNYFAGRVQKEINDGKTQVGGMLTSVNRNIKNEDLLSLPKHAFTGGLDFTQYFDNYKYYLSARLIGSTVNGDAQAIRNLQLASARYFQRPDADYLEYNPELTSLSGYGATFEAGKDASKGWRFKFNLTTRSPELELNDIGYLRNADGIYQYLWTSYRLTELFSVLQHLDFRLNQWYGTDYGGNKITGGQQFAVDTQFSNRWNMYINHNRSEESFSNDNLRGGPALLTPASNSNYLWVRTDQTMPVYVSASAFRRSGTHDNYQYRQANIQIGMQPNDVLNIRLSGMYAQVTNAMQYISQLRNEENPLYLFGEISQKTFSADINISYNISPEISLQYYGAPFVSSALYSEFKEITDSRASDYYDRFAQFTSEQVLYNGATNSYDLNTPEGELSFSNPDFNFNQFRSNFVFRWEYKPGSQLFVVWSQDRTGYFTKSNFSVVESMGNLFSIHSHDIFLLKYSYLIST